jgi:biotin carboxyl carrier protein
MLVLFGVAAPATAAPAGSVQLLWPLGEPGQSPPQVARRFEAPPQPWAAGHRGVDLRGDPGQPVRAPADGIVTHAGPIAGRGVVVVRFGGLRTTLEPVTAAVRVGDRVRAGEVVGHLQAGGHCLPAACLHWGLLRGESYLDPLSMVPVRGADIVLLPLTGPPPQQSWPTFGPFPSDLGSAPATGGAAAAIAFARAQLGDPYVWAATGPSSWDCSGLTMTAWAAAGRALPRNSAAQQAATTPITEAELRPGDLVFWSLHPALPSTVFHVGLYIGNGQMIHAPRPGTTVRVESIYSWARPSFFGRV